MAFPLPTNNSTNLVEFWQYTNTVTDNLWGVSILFLVFTVIYLTLIQNNVQNDRAFNTSLFVTFVSSALLTAMGLVDISVTVLLMITSVVSIYLLR